MSQVEELIQGISSQDSPVEGIIRGRQHRQDLKGEPSGSQVEEFIQGTPSQVSQVEDIIQGGQDRQDQKGEPPDSQVEEFIQGIPTQDSPVEGTIQDRKERQTRRGIHLTIKWRISYRAAHTRTNQLRGISRAGRTGWT